jgi:hypothetical protein
MKVAGEKAGALIGVYCGGCIVDGELSLDRLHCRCEALLTPVNRASPL